MSAPSPYQTAQALRFESLSGHLFHLAPDALHQVAAYHATVAALVRRRRDDLLSRARDARATARSFVPFGHGVAEIALEIGIDGAAHHFDLPRSQVEGLMRLYKKKKIELRDFEIVRLAGRGWSNGMIARRVKLHPVTVSKIIGRALRPQR